VIETREERLTLNVLMEAEMQSVLLAIEHVPTAELLADRLERHDVTAVRVAEGETAQRQVADHDVLVAEARLPGRTGLELLRRRPPLDPPVILIGRRGNDEEVVRAFELGAADYLTRPFAPRVAAARILRFLTFRKQLSSVA